ncbi:hypothetical protein JIN77_11275 [Verrucomicrobiaceae bacterium R5-34]|uniref:Tetratricopeptide repeat protein n=1 Tax=Oceaniferula flava TaxID=2800421 RepID=A0AAE2VCB7_9BACT|nr:hypothetical protein [Oceaniferula flavus]MBK1831311.1 hypothetical protein [Verrucomicrobiaceae bacterium R5-34]MBK1855480.1 hypothetical protein [Oceaniferula flavus]MBM1136786.1 hypothetical protein [Oceaniferula flavus]
MNSKELAESATRGGNPPAGLNQALRSLWLARAGRWEEAHDLCQEIDGPAGAWIHAHLHRVEGDLPNAGYWYSQAGKPQPVGQEKLGEEWLQLVEELAG